ncbi:MAG: hypothetical protein ABSG59_01220 [Verrucomicrobiota bacterium]
MTVTLVAGEVVVPTTVKVPPLVLVVNSFIAFTWNFSISALFVR